MTSNKLFPFIPTQTKQAITTLFSRFTLDKDIGKTKIPDPFAGAILKQAAEAMK